MRLMDGAYRVADLRSYDRNIFRSGGRVANRVLETVPHCWMCDRDSGKQTREHIFARSLLNRFPEEQKQFEPIRLVHMGTAVGSHRGPFPGSALVAGGICEFCNNGWMSSLEVAAAPFLLGDKSEVKGGDISMLAQWFVKTAVIINVSQPYRMLWEASRRHQIREKIPERVDISLYRVPDSDLNWKQGWLTNTSTIAEGVDYQEAYRWLELTHFCQIQIGTLIGVIVSRPWQLSNAIVSMPGKSLWSDDDGHEIRMNELPLAKAFSLDAHLKVQGSAFLR